MGCALAARQAARGTAAPAGPAGGHLVRPAVVAAASSALPWASADLSASASPPAPPTRQQKSGGKRFACAQCASAFSERANLNECVKVVHERRRPFPCGVCKARFQRRGHMSKHARAVHDGLRQFECKECGGRFGCRGMLKNHRRSVHGVEE